MNSHGDLVLRVRILFSCHCVYIFVYVHIVTHVCVYTYMHMKSESRSVEHRTVSFSVELNPSKFCGPFKNCLIIV